MRGLRRDRGKSSAAPETTPPETPDPQAVATESAAVAEAPAESVEAPPEVPAGEPGDESGPGDPEVVVEEVAVTGLVGADGSVDTVIVDEVVVVAGPDGTVEAVEVVEAIEADGTVEVLEVDEVVVTPDVETSDPAPEPKAVGAGTDPEDTAQAASGNPLPRVLAVANQKGGVGKTTTSVNLGAALAELGFRVLVIDLDPQGNATTGLGIDARNFELSMYDVLMRDSSLEDCVEPTSMKNLFVAPATIDLAGAEIELVPAFSRELKLKRAIETVIDDFDFVLIDCPPSLGLITVNALAAADEVLVPIQCEYYALEGLSQLMRNVHLVASNLNAGLDISTIVLTMYDARTKLAEQVADRGAGALRQQGLPDRHPPDGAALGGPVVRTADHGVRSGLPRGHRLPGTSQGGQRWHVVAGWGRA